MPEAIKTLHLTCVGLSYALFVLRGLWMIGGHPMRERRWVKIVPHVNDTLLLAAGLSLAFMIRQYPFVDGWLTAKVLGVIGYILLGSAGLKHGRTQALRIGFWIAAQAMFFYIVAVALTRNPNPLATVL